MALAMQTARVSGAAVRSAAQRPQRRSTVVVRANGSENSSENGTFFYRGKSYTSEEVRDTPATIWPHKSLVHIACAILWMADGARSPRVWRFWAVVVHRRDARHLRRPPFVHLTPPVLLRPPSSVYCSGSRLSPTAL